ncbi:hypothetical protein NSQ54_10510 [Alkalihalobacillus sp. FSL W8-0930]
MSKCKITNIEKSEKIDEWGILQINNLKDTFFRFDLIDGKLQLDTSFFVNKEGEISEKDLSEESQLYKDVLQALNEYYRNVPVIVFKNKSRDDRYLASSMDEGDCNDENLDISLDNIQSGFMLWRPDLQTPPDQSDVESLRAGSEALKKHVRDRYGSDSAVSFDVENWLKYYDPVNIVVTRDQFDYAKQLIIG